MRTCELRNSASTTCYEKSCLILHTWKKTISPHNRGDFLFDRIIKVSSDSSFPRFKLSNILTLKHNPMLKTQFTLIAKKNLTHDVYELIYVCPELSKEPPNSGQYVMFQLAPGLNRAYSLASFSLQWTVQLLQDSNTPTIKDSHIPTFTLIIKRIPDGRGSPIICDAEVWAIFIGIIPLGHFTLHDTPKSKCFIGTGTGFAPLYCQLLASQSLAHPPTKCAFIFGVRNFTDGFYEEEILSLWETFDAFEYIQYFSRESDFQRFQASNLPTFQQWYVTDWITPEHMSHYEEYYICGSPAMVKSAREKLEFLGIQKENIFWEQF